MKVVIQVLIVCLISKTTFLRRLGVVVKESGMESKVYFFPSSLLEPSTRHCIGIVRHLPIDLSIADGRRRDVRDVSR